MAWRQWSDRGLFLSSIFLSWLINRNKDCKSLLFKRILIFKEDEIGDLVIATPAFRLLRKQFPDAEITVVTRPFGVHLLQYNSDINRVTADYKTLDGRYDLVVDLRGTPASTFFALRHRPLLRLDRGTIRYRNRKLGHQPREIETNRQVIAPVVDARFPVPDPQVHISGKEREEARRFLESHQVGAFALFHTGARRMLKKWPLERVALVMRWLYERYGLQPVLVGDAADAADVTALQPMVPFPIHTAAGRLSLLAFAALCEKAELFIGNDSGPFHIAAAMGTRSLALFGPGDPVFHPHQNNAAFLHHILECNPCDMVHCKYREFPCIQRITTDEVKEKITALLKR